MEIGGRGGPSNHWQHLGRVGVGGDGVAAAV